MPASDADSPRERLDDRAEAVRDRTTRVLRTAREHARPPVVAAHERLRAAASRDPGGVVEDAAAIAFAALLHVLVRYLPQYLHALGAGPAAIGLVGSVGILAGALWPYLRGSASSVVERTGRLASVPRPTARRALASVGPALWLLAPQTGSAPSVAWTVGAVLAGVLCVGAWPSKGFEMAFSVPTWGSRSRSARRPSNASGARRYLSASLVALVLAAALSPLFPTFRAEFGVASALTAAVGLTAALVVRDNQPTPTGARAAGVRWPDIADLLSRLRSLPASSRRLLTADALVQFAAGATSVFVVRVVVGVLGVDAVLLGRRFGPVALFGAFAAVELAVALAGSLAARRLTDDGTRAPLAAVDLLAVASFPLLLTSAPAAPSAVAALFALSGLRALGRPARRALVEAVLPESVGAREYRSARNAAVVPSALLGGLLYAVSPHLAFGLATAAGAVGLAEFCHFVRPLERATSD